MQPRVILDTSKIVVLAIVKAFIDWVKILAMCFYILMLCFVFGGENIGTTMTKFGIVEIIISGSYALATTSSIWNAGIKNKTFYCLIMVVSIAIATSIYLLFDGLFVFCLFLGSVAIWYQITLTQLRGVTTPPG